MTERESKRGWKVTKNEIRRKESKEEKRGDIDKNCGTKNWKVNERKKRKKQKSRGKK